MKKKKRFMYKKNTGAIIRPKKMFGQHFLNSRSAIQKMIEAVEIEKGERVLEIGPGRGVLTRALLEAGARVLAVEKDRELVEFLRQEFATEISAGTLTLIESDILDFSFSNYSLFPSTYSLVSNIPYYITGAILEKFLSGKFQPTKMVLLVQKEVAERVMARDGKESILSLSVKVYGEPKIITKVPRGAFTPPPKVDSAILLVKDISRKNFRGSAAERKFFRLVKTAFAHKRKFAIANLSAIFPREKLEKAFEKLTLSPKARAENIPLPKWLALSRML